VNRTGQRLMGTRKGEPSSALCDRAPSRTRVTSPRQLPTDHVHVGGPCARSTYNRLINRRRSSSTAAPSVSPNTAALPTGEPTRCQVWRRAAGPRALRLGYRAGRSRRACGQSPPSAGPNGEERTAEISAGIDGSLHNRAHLKIAAARETGQSGTGSRERRSSVSGFLFLIAQFSGELRFWPRRSGWPRVGQLRR